MTNEEVVCRLYEELNAGNLDVIEEVCAEDLAGHLLFYPWSVSSRPQAQGSAFFKEVVRHGQETAAYRYNVEKTLSAADSVTVIVRLEGSRGGKAIVLYEMIIYRFLDGKIVEAWVMGDGLGFFQQVGAVPERIGLPAES